MDNNLFYFEKVPFEQFKEDCSSFCTNEEFLRKKYDEIKLPQASTALSAGFDFFSPFTYHLYPPAKIRIPTGIRWCPDCGEDTYGGYHLNLYPISGLGCNHRLQLSNTVGIIDADYYLSDNYGHIIIDIFYPQPNDIEWDWYGDEDVITVYSDIPSQETYPVLWTLNRVLKIETGMGFAQGIIEPHMRLDKFTRNEVRNGGFGSTSK